MFDSTTNNRFKVKYSVASGDTSHQFDPQSAVKSDGFCNALKVTLTMIGESPVHVCHFGRSYGPSLLELLEVCESAIKQLRNWEEKVFNFVTLPLCHGKQ